MIVWSLVSQLMGVPALRTITLRHSTASLMTPQSLKKGRTDRTFPCELVQPNDKQRSKGYMTLLKLCAEILGRGKHIEMPSSVLASKIFESLDDPLLATLHPGSATTAKVEKKLQDYPYIFLWVIICNNQNPVTLLSAVHRVWAWCWNALCRASSSTNCLDFLLRFSYISDKFLLGWWNVDIETRKI